ncbi:hypothetical protein [Halalkalicoccus salilacus]|uniref:hypothetical protein n=1 Tax=Halalkalicoccus sp. GCM10025704 TaxID=3252662 RepID=UPI003608D7E8
MFDDELSHTDETDPAGRIDPFGRLRTLCERVSDRWRRLDRGWQAVLLGLGIVGARLLVQAV